MRTSRWMWLLILSLVTLTFCQPDFDSMTGGPGGPGGPGGGFPGGGFPGGGFPGGGFPGGGFGGPPPKPMEGMGERKYMGKFEAYNNDKIDCGIESDGDPWDILQVTAEADIKELKKSYRKLTLKYHPDKQHSASTEEKELAQRKFLAITRAYDILSDPMRKHIYSALGPSMLKQYDGMVVEGMPKDVNPFSSVETAIARGEVDQGPPEKYDIRVPLETIYNGGFFVVDRDVQTMCDACNGKGGHSMVQCANKECKNGWVAGTPRRNPRTGQMMSEPSACPHCHGSKKVPSKICPVCKGRRYYYTRKVTRIAIAPGLPVDYIQTVPNGGHYLPGGAAAGELMVRIQYEKHDIYSVIPETHNVKMVLKIELRESIYGINRQILYLDNDYITVNVPGVIQPGQTVTISGRGMPINSGAETQMKGNFPNRLQKDGSDKKNYSHHTMKKGDLIIEFSVVFPLSAGEARHEICSGPGPDGSGSTYASASTSAEL